MLLPAVFLVVVTAALSSPLRVLYDQRQEGEWNVNADFKNIVVMLIPTQTSSSTPSTGTLLDLFVKAVPKRNHVKKLQKKVVPGEETMHFIESKTAPYHVDISRSKNHLAKLHPEAPPSVINAEEIVIAKSPSVELVKDQSHARVARAFVVEIPEAQVKREISGESVLKLLGAENEQCGPGLARDPQGVCRTVKN